MEKRALFQENLLGSVHCKKTSCGRTLDISMFQNNTVKQRSIKTG